MVVLFNYLLCLVVGDSPEGWPVPDCSTCPPFKPATNRTTEVNVVVSNPNKLPSSLSTIDRHHIGQLEDYKPTLALLGNGDLLVASTYGYPGGTHPIFFRSTNGGQTWGPRLDNYTNLSGLEWQLRTLRDGSVFLIAGGYPNGGRVYHSSDYGYTWTLVFDWPLARAHVPYHDSEMGWGVVEVNASEVTPHLPVGIYIFPGNQIWRSDYGSWNFTLHANVTKGDNMDFLAIDSFFGQSSTPWLDSDGVLNHLTRNGIDPTFDQNDGSQHWISKDGGQTWNCAGNAVGNWCKTHKCTVQLKPFSTQIPTNFSQCSNMTASFGQAGTMYPIPLRLNDGRMLITYTQRCNGASGYDHQPPSSFNAPACAHVQDGYGTGLRATIVNTNNGIASFDLSEDVIVIKAQDDWYDVWKYHGCMCGFGGTVQMKNGTLVSVYCYANAKEVETLGKFAPRLSVVRWNLS
eukprot:m.76625 g.76625  ORF g.76625 m.76625 type:complete len:459 (+) comp12569_c0_seq1:161-1537(+)